jgi:hypothetical protein
MTCPPGRRSPIPPRGRRRRRLPGSHGSTATRARPLLAVRKRDRPQQHIDRAQVC